VILLNSISDVAAVAHKSTARLALMFGLVFAVLASAHYFIQISTELVALHVQTRPTPFPGIVYNRSIG
jgi:hypothetical protein